MAKRRNGMFKKNAQPEHKVIPSIADILHSLNHLHDPIDQSNLVSHNRLSGITVKDGTAQVCLSIDPSHKPQYKKLTHEIETRLLSIPGIEKVLLVLTAHKSIETPSVEHKAISRGHLVLPNIKHIIAIGSGKGGVGKSTVSVNLATAFQQMGFKVGLLDADIYGPSIPMMLNLFGQPAVNEDKQMVPLMAHGIKTMSMGYLIEGETPVIWRGPMIQSALQKFLVGVDWGHLDVLFIDLPPGTGDVQLTLLQKVPLKGAIIVSTPQDIALIDAQKALNMFQKVDTPILGMIENMSFFECPCCKTRTSIFNQHGVQNSAHKQSIPFLGAIPLHIDIRESCDDGTPYSLGQKKSNPFHDIALTIAHHLDLSSSQVTHS